MKKLTGYKVFGPDWKCIDFQYKVGKTYIHKGPIEKCVSGFHFCLNLADCFEYYSFNNKNKVAIIESLDKFITDGNKTVCNKIKIVKEISWHDVQKMVNTGQDNTGLMNSGDVNSGDRNSGYMNSGDRNSGYRNSGYMNSGYMNSGDRNSGYRNSGYKNSGDRNSGYRNSGDMNSGDRNSGDMNSGDRNSGYMNSDVPKHPRLFNKDSKASWTCIDNVNIIMARNWYDKFSTWIDENNMSKTEKETFPSYKTTGGYLRQATYKESWTLMWENISSGDKTEFYKLPNFDAKVFQEITGLNVARQYKLWLKQGK